MELPQIQNLQIRPSTLRQRVKGFPNNTVGYLEWYLRHLTQMPPKIEELKSALLTNDIILWTTGPKGHRNEEFVLVDLIATKMNIAFLHILTEERDISSDWISSTNDTIERVEELVNQRQPPLQYTVKDSDHFQGMKIILQSLKVLHGLQFNFAETMASNAQVPSLSKPKEEAISKIMEARFLYEFVSFHNRKDGESKLLKNALDLDPNDWEWHLKGYIQIRWDNQGQNIHRILGDQRTLLARVMEMNEDHPMCIVNCCEALALLIINRCEYPLNHGTRVFNSQAEAIKYLRNMAEKFLDEYPSPQWMFTYAKLFGDQLRGNADDRFAIRLLSKGLETAPNSSKLNHRKAIVLAKLGEFEGADACIRIAVQSDERNKDARLDMAKLFLRNKDLDSVHDELCKIFGDEYFESWRSSYKPGTAIVNSLFLKGYFLMRINQTGAAIRTWLDWVPLYNLYLRNPSMFNFQANKLQGLEKRWGWDWQLEEFGKFVKTVVQALQAFVRDHPDQRRDKVQLLHKLLGN